MQTRRTFAGMAVAGGEGTTFSVTATMPAPCSQCSSFPTGKVVVTGLAVALAGWLITRPPTSDSSSGLNRLRRALRTV